MENASINLRKFRVRIGIALFVLFGSQAFSAEAQDQNDKRRLREADRQTCLNGQSGQALAPCMKEANAAFSQRTDANPTASPEQLLRNRLMRCEALNGTERTACEARMHGEGNVSGSVGGGGLLRELTTTEVPGRLP
jgi:hypothetical protein